MHRGTASRAPDDRLLVRQDDPVEARSVRIGREGFLVEAVLERAASSASRRRARTVHHRLHLPRRTLYDISSHVVLPVEKVVGVLLEVVAPGRATTSPSSLAHCWSLDVPRTPLCQRLWSSAVTPAIGARRRRLRHDPPRLRRAHGPRGRLVAGARPALRRAGADAAARRPRPRTVTRDPVTRAPSRPRRAALAQRAVDARPRPPARAAPRGKAAGADAKPSPRPRAAAGPSPGPGDRVAEVRRASSLREFGGRGAAPSASCGISISRAA